MPRAAKVQYEAARYHILSTGIKNLQLYEYLNLGHPAAMSNLVETINRT